MNVIGALCPHGRQTGSVQRGLELGAFVSLSELKTRGGEALPGLLGGLAIAVKDNIDVADSITAAGSEALASSRAAFDARVVDLLKQAGASIAARTRMDEFAMTTSGPAMRNPFDEGRSVGGSSGGSAIAVAAGGFCAALGTDTGGSVRIPASYCGVIGFKPSFGRVSLDGVVPLAPSLDHVGVLACSAGVARLVFAEIAEDSTPAAAGPAHGSFNRLRIGIPSPDYLAAATSEVRAAFDDTIGLLRAEGVEAVEVDLPSFDRVRKAHYPVALVEALRYHEAAFSDLSRHGVEVRAILEHARQYTDAAYRDAQAERARLTHELGALLRAVDVVALPTTPTVAPPRDASSIRLGTGDEVDRVMGSIWYTALFNDTGLPAISLPQVKDGALPVGVQFVARHGADEYLLDLAQEVEALVAGPRVAPDAPLVSEDVR